MTIDARRQYPKVQQRRYRQAARQGGMVIPDAFRLLRHRLPFPIKDIHTDNGSEFLSGHMLRFWSQEDPSVLLTRLNQPPQLRRQYDTPKIPLQRLYAAKILDDTQQKALDGLRHAPKMCSTPSRVTDLTS